MKEVAHRDDTALTGLDGPLSYQREESIKRSGKEADCVRIERGRQSNSFNP